MDNSVRGVAAVCDCIMKRKWKSLSSAFSNFWIRPSRCAREECTQNNMTQYQSVWRRGRLRTVWMTAASPPPHSVSGSRFFSGNLHVILDASKITACLYVGSFIPLESCRYGLWYCSGFAILTCEGTHKVLPLYFWARSLTSHIPQLWTTTPWLNAWAQPNPELTLSLQRWDVV